jgi:hypothetical protein
MILPYDATLRRMGFSEKTARFFAEFLRRLREAPPGTRVYMSVGDVFKDADVHSIDEWRAARQAAVVRDDDDEGEEPRR